MPATFQVVYMIGWAPHNLSLAPSLPPSLPQELYGEEDGSVPATFQVVYMIGWAPHESQPQPKKRGSGRVSLKTLQKGDLNEGGGSGGGDGGGCSKHK